MSNFGVHLVEIEIVTFSTMLDLPHIYLGGDKFRNFDTFSLDVRVLRPSPQVRFSLLARCWQSSECAVFWLHRGHSLARLTEKTFCALICRLGPFVERLLNLGSCVAWCALFAYYSSLFYLGNNLFILVAPAIHPSFHPNPSCDHNNPLAPFWLVFVMTMSRRKKTLFWR